MEIDYGILGPDIILHIANMYCQLGLAYYKVGYKERAIDALLCAWDGRRKHEEEQVQRLRTAFTVLTLSYDTYDRVMER